MEEQAEAITEQIALQPQTPMVHLVARNPVEMQDARANLALWLRHKIASVTAEIAELQEAIDHAKRNKWNARTLQNQKLRAEGRQMFYTKTLAAVEAGYTIVPEFPIDVFAIRVSRETPSGETRTADHKYLAPYLEQPDILPVGEGDYVSDVPKTSLTLNQDQAGGKIYSLEPTALRDVVFPIRAARIEVMDATSEAMALQVFDRIGICPAQRKADPLIIGQILCRKEGYNQRVVNFLIAWHLNLSEL